MVVATFAPVQQLLDSPMHRPRLTLPLLSRLFCVGGWERMTEKRPSHESEMASLFLSDNVAPKAVRKIVELEKKGLRGNGLFVATAIALSAENDPEFWRRFAETLEFERKLLEYLEALYREGKPVSRAFLEQVQQRYAEEIAPFRPKPWVVWKGAFDVSLFEFKDEKYIIVKGRKFEFKIPVE
jgi:hypothetical protein